MRLIIIDPTNNECQHLSCVLVHVCCVLADVSSSLRLDFSWDLFKLPEYGYLHLWISLQIHAIVCCSGARMASLALGFFLRPLFSDCVAVACFVSLMRTDR